MYAYIAAAILGAVVISGIFYVGADYGSKRCEVKTEKATAQLQGTKATAATNEIAISTKATAKVITKTQVISEVTHDAIQVIQAAPKSDTCLLPDDLRVQHDRTATLRDVRAAPGPDGSAVGAKPTPSGAN